MQARSELFEQVSHTLEDVWVAVALAGTKKVRSLRRSRSI